MIRAIRADQLEYQALDQQIRKELHSAMDNSLKPVASFTLLKSLLAEIKLALDMYIFTKTVKGKGATPGQYALNLLMQDGRNPGQKISQRQILGLGFASIIIPYLKQKLSQFATWIKEKYAQHSGTLSLMLNIIGFAMMIVDGLPSNIVARLLSVGLFVRPGLGSVKPDFKGFSINLTKKFFYQVMIQVAQFILGGDVQRWILSKFAFLKGRASSDRDVSERSEDDLKYCVICKYAPNLPHEIGCRHVFCFFCITSDIKRFQKKTYSCPACYYQIVDESHVKPVTLKTN